jgi:hypothetical protein
MIRISACLLVCLLMVFAASASAAECKAVEGDYVVNLSGFGGSSSFYPVALIGNLTIDKDGVAKGNYKLHVPFQTGTMANRNVTGKLSMSKCVGTLKLDLDGRTIHTFTVIGNAEGGFALATGEVGLVVSGTASK